MEIAFDHGFDETYFIFQIAVNVAAGNYIKQMEIWVLKQSYNLLLLMHFTSGGIPMLTSILFIQIKTTLKIRVFICFFFAAVCSHVESDMDLESILRYVQLI